MPFPIKVRFLGGLTPRQQEVFSKAAVRWEKIITGTAPTVRIGDDTIEGLLIEAKGKKIDLPGRVLGQSAPTHARPEIWSRPAVDGIPQSQADDCGLAVVPVGGHLHATGIDER